MLCTSRPAGVHSPRPLLPVAVGSRCRGRTTLVHSLLVPQPAAVKPPRAETKVRLDKLFLDTHEEMLARNLRVMQVPLLLSQAYYFRHPDDVWAILSKDDILFAKSGRIAQSKEWLGSGVFSQVDADKHAAARATLNPAFRREYLQMLDGFMISSAQKLAALLTAAAGPQAAPAPSQQPTAGAQQQKAAVDVQRLFRLLTLDTIGLTSLNTSFGAMELWEQQHMQQQQQQAQMQQAQMQQQQPQLELERMLWDLESAFLWQSLQLPLPRSWLPGWSAYIKACDQLNKLIDDILQQTKAEQQRPQPSQLQEQSSPSSTSTSSSSSRQTLVSFLLAAQQQQGPDLISDSDIRDEIKTIMFGGTDTSAFTLAMYAHYLAGHPAAADRAAAEVATLLQQTGRRSVGELRAADIAKLPWVTACVNETMRLAPAGPVITRTALEDTEVSGCHIPQGMMVATNIYAMHRHPDFWPDPTSWRPERWIPAEAAAAGLSTRSVSDGSKAQLFLPFSTGPRSCIGRNYAMLQMVITMGVLLGSGIRFQSAGQGPLELVKSMTMHAKHGIWLTPCVCEQVALDASAGPIAP